MTLRATDRLVVDGQTITRQTRNMLLEAEALLGIGHVRITQGSFTDDVGASAGTHSGSGAVDLPARPYGVSPQRWVEALRRVGFAAWHRTPSDGFSSEHVHALVIGDPGLAPVAARQVDSYRAGRNGLVSNLFDRDPKVVPIITWHQYRQLPTVSVEAMQRAWAMDRKRLRGLHPGQTRRVQKALGFRVLTGRWGGKTRKAFPDKGPTLATLRALGAGRFRVVP